MKIVYTSVKRALCLCVMSLAFASAFAGAGFWDEQSATINFSSGSYTVNKQGQGEINIGSVSSLTFNSFRTNTWKKDGGNICNGKIHYAVYKSGSSASSWKEFESTYKSGDGTNQTWGGDNINVNLLSGLDKGDCYFEFYITHDGNDNSGGCDKEYTLNNGGPNYKIKFNNNSAGGSCDVQAKGAAIPANTIIFFDNSNNTIPGGSIYLSVPTESGNGNATTLNQGSYVPSRDKWYTMTDMGNGVWRTIITEASSYGRMSFWSKDMSGYGDVWQATVAFQIPYQSGKNIFKSNTTECYNDNRQTSYATKGAWDTRSGLDLTASAYSFKEGDTTPITLTALAIGIPASTYIFEYKTFDSDQWQTLASQSASTYTLSGAGLPSKTTYYRVRCGSYTSEEIRIAVIMQCKAESSKNLIKYDFGTFNVLTGTGSRRSASGMAPDYTFRDYPSLVDDGDYAVVPTPYYCGCGAGSFDGCDHCHDVEHDCNGNYWFRDLGDHSDPSHSKSPFGGMLFINFDQHKSKIAYEHDLTAEEKGLFVKGSTLSFSAWFASATKDAAGIPIDMKLSIQYKPAGSTVWQDNASIATQVSYDEKWEQGITSIDIDDVNGDYRVIIENNAASGVGNDVLIDDISLDLCIPDFNVEFYTNSGDTYTSYSYKNIEHVENIRIPKKDYGFGNSNTVLLVAVDESKSIGQAGRYKYLGEMSLNSAGTYYTTTRSATQLMNELNVTPDYNGKLQVIITEPGTNIPTFVRGLENGTIKPFPVGDTSVLASTNMLSYNINCQPAISAHMSSTEPVCELSGKKDGTEMPSIDVTFGHISNFVEFSLVFDGTTTLVSHEELDSDKAAAGKFSVYLDNFEQTVRVPGTHTFVVQVYEYMLDSHGEPKLICNKSTQAVTLVVKDKPAYNMNAWPTVVDYCLQKYLEVNALHTTSYTWYVDKGENPTVENWELIPNATSARYNMPVDLKDGWRYKVELGNEYCSVVTSSPVTVNRVASDAPETEDYIECVLKTGGTVKPLADLVKSQYTLLKWYKEDKTTVVTDPTFNTGVSTESPVFYYVTDTRASGCESEPSQVIVHVKPSAAKPVVVEGGYNECLDENKRELELNTLFDYDPELEYHYYSATGALNSSVVDISTPGTNTYEVEAVLDGCSSDKAQIPVTVIAVSDTPEIVEGGYNECAVDGTKALADLVTSDKTELHWYDATGAEVVPAVFSTSTPVDGKEYFVTNTERGKCVSKQAMATVTVRVNSVKPITKNYKECLDEDKPELDLNTLITNPSPVMQYQFYDGSGQLMRGSSADISVPGTANYSVVAVSEGCLSEKSPMTVTVKNNAVAADINVNGVTACKGTSAQLSATTTTVQPSPVFNWYADADLANKIATGAVYSFTASEDNTVYVTVQNADYCENLPGNGAEAEITVMIPVSSMKLTPEKDAIRLGDQTTKILELQPADVQFKSVTWTANDQAFDPESFPATPYQTQNYKVVLVDECDVRHEATAVTEVEWPTVFMPYNPEGTNFDFVTGVEGGIELLVFDRTGNMVAHTYDGWDGTVKDGKFAMPDVYYYKAILPDGSTKLGAVEILKK